MAVITKQSILIALACVSLSATAADMDPMDFTPLRAIFTEQVPGSPDVNQIGLVFPSNGSMSKLGSLQPPVKSTCVPGWRLGNGTEGQSHTTFAVNGSWFHLAQEICGEEIKQTSVFSVIGPFGWGPPDKVPVYQLYNNKDQALPMDQFNIQWDYACNVNLLSPQKTGNDQVFHTLQVSEYDGAVRPKKDYFEEDLTCDDCWRKVPGASGFDHGSQQFPWSPELNCGDDCVLYTLEEYIKGGVAQKPRQVIGRSFRTSKLFSNITDSVQIQTLTSDCNLFQCQSSKRGMFLGLGVCCEEEWCDPGCKGHDNELVLFAYGALDNKPYILDMLGMSMDQDKKFAEKSIQLGVVVNAGWNTKDPIPAHVLVGTHIRTYMLQYANSKYRVTSTHDSAELEKMPSAWTVTRPMMEKSVTSKQEVLK